MPTVRVLRQSFSGGEISPRLFGRIDFANFQTGLETCKNFIALPHGSAMNRPGFRYVNEANADPASAHPLVRLIPFTFSNSQSFALEFGYHYIRFHTNGGTLLDGALPYEVVTPYNDETIHQLKYVQSGDVITLTHPGYAARELKRLSNLNWTLTTIAFQSNTAAPENVVAVDTQPTPGGSTPKTYKITALNSFGFEESPPSDASNSVGNNLTVEGNYNTVTWDAVTGAAVYNVYKSANGSYGFVGQTAGLTFRDDNVLADMTKTLPLLEDPFPATGDNDPTAVCYYEQRRFFAGTNNQPMNVWATQSGSENNMSYTIPSQDSDALRFKIQANRSDIIRHLVNLQDLIILTASNEWRVTAQGSGALTPTSINIKSQSQVGASELQPKVVDNFLLYEAAQGGHIREFAYDWQNNGFRSGDLSLLATHLFDGYTIKDMCFSRAPWPILWCVSSSGKLLGITYVPEQKIAAWHQHDTANGVIESCCTLVEDGRDVLYIVTKRTIPGGDKRFIERLDLREFTDPADAFFVDCGLTYDGAATSTLSGLDHLEGLTVNVLGDGAVMDQKTVTSGSITLESPVTKAQVGLPITAQLKTLPTVFQDTTFGQSRIKNVNKVWVRVDRSGPFKAGPDADHLTPIKFRRFEALGDPVELQTGEFDLVVKSAWTPEGSVLIQQDDPLPLEVVYVATEVAVGG